MSPPPIINSPVTTITNPGRRRPLQNQTILKVGALQVCFARLRKVIFQTLQKIKLHVVMSSGLHRSPPKNQALSSRRLLIMATMPCPDKKLGLHRKIFGRADVSILILGKLGDPSPPSPHRVIMHPARTFPFCTFESCSCFLTHLRLTANASGWRGLLV